jgi:hypothetical protein
MKAHLNDIITTNEDPEDIFQLLEKLGKYGTPNLKAKEITAVFLKP